MWDDESWDLFSDLLNQVVRFCTKMARETPPNLPRDVFYLRVVRGPVPAEALKGTVYERRVELLWRAGDMPLSYRETYSDCWGMVRNHWQELQNSFGDYDLRARPKKDCWQAELALPPLGRRPVVACYGTGY